MDDKVKELVEWEAKRDYMWRFCGIPDEYESEWLKADECTKQSCRAFAKDILSNPSLCALVERELPIRFMHPDDKPNVSYSKAQQDMLKRRQVVSDRVQALKQGINYILAVKSSQRCGTEKCNQYNDCDSCLSNQILSFLASQGLGWEEAEDKSRGFTSVKFVPLEIK